MKPTATYSPEDNKLRLYPVSRLDAETYARVKAAGFSWAPKQELFVAPAWTPERADLLEELCGEIGDEDKSLVERAEERADRFEEYSDKREADAESARAAVSRIADNIPMGQPILVGHHSEKRARKDAERIENGMRRAVKMWETAKYWESRAKSAVRAAKYKELPGVRHRRIKTLESERRGFERTLERAEAFLRAWQKPDLTLEGARAIANLDHTSVKVDGLPYGLSLWSALTDGKLTLEQAIAHAVDAHTRTIEGSQRWIAHLTNRLAYERAMLAESGPPPAERFPVEVGGRVLVRSTWCVVSKVNRSNGAINSVSIVGRRGAIPIETVSGYQPPEEGAADKVKAAAKLPPLVNYPGEGFRHMTTEEWKKRTASDFWRVIKLKATAERGACRIRAGIVGGGDYRDVYVYLTDAKRVDPPAPAAPAEPDPALAPETVPREPRAAARKAEPTAYDSMREQLRQGVKVVAAPQLFPTPPDLAERMVREAGVEPGHRCLEPSAGTGVIARALMKRVARAEDLVLVEINDWLANAIGAKRADFLTLAPDNLGGRFDRIVMNPPFADKADIEHVTHALEFLKPGGVLVSVMSAGVRFREDGPTRAFRELVEARGGTIVDLPEGTFSDSGTNVRTVLVTLRGW